MQPKKEHYRRKLPHFQQPGQRYSVTCTLNGAMPKGAMQKYSIKVEMARNRMEQLGIRLSPGVGLSKSDKISNLGTSESQSPEFLFAEAKKEYQIALRKYRIAYNKVLNKSALPGISLVKEVNRIIVEEALLFWEGKRLTSHVWCIMSNHFHWILSVFEKDKNGKPVYLQDILHSIKLFSARRINVNENRSGQLWEEESFDTTIRNDRHFVNVLNYVILNPVSAGLVKDWRKWPGTRVFEDTTFLSP